MAGQGGDAAAFATARGDDLDAAGLVVVPADIGDLAAIA